MHILEPAVVSSSMALHAADAELTEAVQGRLIVVLRAVGEPALLAARMQAVASARRQGVLILGVISRPDTEAPLRRRLTLLSAFLQEAGTPVEIRLTREQHALQDLETVLRDADLLAYCASDIEPREAEDWAHLLGGRFRRPVYVFLDQAAVVPVKRMGVARLLPWLVSAAIILGFLWLQVSLSQAGGSVSANGWLIGSVPIEIGLIWLVNVLVA